MTLSATTVRTFERCLFDKDYTGVDNWEELYTAYIDTSGLGQEGQLGLHVAIHNLDVRLKDITDFLEFQSKIYRLVNMPHVPTIDDVKKYGHRLTWPSDDFLDQLNAIESKEKRKYVELKKLNKELRLMKDAEKPGTISARNQWLIMLNILSKDQGYKIDRDNTYMDELSLLIKQHGDDVRAANSSNG